MQTLAGPFVPWGRAVGGWGWDGHCKAGASLREEALEDECLHPLSRAISKPEGDADGPTGCTEELKGALPCPMSLPWLIGYLTSF